MDIWQFISNESGMGYVLAILVIVLAFVLVYAVLRGVGIIILTAIKVRAHIAGEKTDQLRLQLEIVRLGQPQTKLAQPKESHGQPEMLLYEQGYSSRE